MLQFYILIQMFCICIQVVHIAITSFLQLTTLVLKGKSLAHCWIMAANCKFTHGSFFFLIDIILGLNIFQSAPCVSHVSSLSFTGGFESSNINIVLAVLFMKEKPLIVLWIWRHLSLQFWLFLQQFSPFRALIFVFRFFSLPINSLPLPLNIYGFPKFSRKISPFILFFFLILFLLLKSEKSSYGCLFYSLSISSTVSPHYCIYSLLESLKVFSQNHGHFKLVLIYLDII